MPPDQPCLRLPSGQWVFCFPFPSASYQCSLCRLSAGVGVQLREGRAFVEHLQIIIFLRVLRVFNISKFPIGLHQFERETTDAGFTSRNSWTPDAMMSEELSSRATCKRDFPLTYQRGLRFFSPSNPTDRVWMTTCAIV